jgi:pimeloyl-ACP methyl ester carboxylesterase
MRRALVMLVALLVVAPAAQARYKLQPSSAQLADSLRCTGALKDAKRDPVLLLAGTTVNSDADFNWNYEPALREREIPFCVSDMPGELSKNMGDIQLRAEYVVYALREMHKRSGRKVAVYGHSQGGMVTRWALRWWPDTRKLVSDVIGAAPSNRGTIAAAPLCAIGCAPALWQQRDDSKFIKALNSGQQTFAGIDYTAISSRLDEVVVPYTSQALHGPGRIANVIVQRICPGDLADHLLLGTSDPVAYALVIDALTHDGPANPARIDRAVCSQLLHPGVDPATFPVDLASAATVLALSLAGSTRAAAEPPLAPYTRH